MINKKGESSISPTLVAVIIAILVIVLAVAAFIIIKGSGYSAIDFVKNLFTLRR